MVVVGVVGTNGVVTAWSAGPRRVRAWWDVLRRWWWWGTSIVEISVVGTA